LRLWILAVGNRMPGWVNEGFGEYIKRMPAELRTELIEVRPEPRGRPVERLLTAEGERLLAALPRDARLVALDEHGAQWSTTDLAERMRDWMREGRDVGFAIGGADGLDADIKQRAESRFGLSRLTLPHGLARVLLAEQIYRAASLLRGHPYHRA
jgi:23S rRNA (pseudouridine1915-N3)-methyltransferase